MSTHSWTRALALAAAVWVAATAALANPAKAPKRVVGQQTVDLTPLFRWWTNRSGARPLTGWVHVTGTVIGANSYGWVVDARVEAVVRPGQAPAAEPAKGDLPKKLLLRHPPLQDRAAFESLAAQLKALTAQRAQAADAEAQAHRHAQPETDNTRRINSKAETWQRQEAMAAEEDAAARKEELDKQIQALKARLAAWPNPDHYQVDCFALETGGELNKLPLFEHGASWP